MTTNKINHRLLCVAAAIIIVLACAVIYLIGRARLQESRLVGASIAIALQTREIAQLRKTHYGWVEPDETTKQEILREVNAACDGGDSSSIWFGWYDSYRGTTATPEEKEMRDIHLLSVLLGWVDDANMSKDGNRAAFKRVMRECANRDDFISRMNMVQQLEKRNYGNSTKLNVE